MGTITESIASGSTATFPLGFPYIDKSHVEVRLDGVLKTAVTHYNVVGSNVVFVGGNVTAGVKVLLRRVTPTAALTVFLPGQLSAAELNAAETQALYLGEEARDHSEYVKSILIGIDIADAVAEVEADRAEVAANTVLVDADRVVVAADKGTVAADKATVVADKAIVAGYRTDVQGYLSTATGAASSAAAAQVAAEAALALTLSAYDSFDDRYLGAKAANPTLDNDGNALVGGTLYYNTVSLEMLLWNGSAWVAAYVSGTGLLAAANNLSDVQSISTTRTNLDVFSTSQVLALPFGRTAKTTIVDADTLSMTDSAAADVWKKITWANFKGQVLAYLQGVAWTMSAKLTTVLSGTGGAGFNLPHGVAPTSPVNGDLWTTTAGLLARINGSTRAFLWEVAYGNILASSIATAAEYRANTASKLIDAATLWSASGRVTLTDAGTIAADFNTFIDTECALGGNRTLGAGSNLKDGQKGVMWFTAVTSTRTLTLNAAYILATGAEAGPYSITTAQSLGVVYVVRNGVVYVTSIIRIG